MTKTEAMHILKLYMHDARIAGRREGYREDRNQVWQQMVETWVADGEVTPETGRAWIERGPR